MGRASRREAEDGLLKLELKPGDQELPRRSVLWAIYVGRLTVAAGILVGALSMWRTTRPDETLIATLAFLAAVFFSGGSHWWTHQRAREPGLSFLLAQSMFDVAMTTAIVHITGGGASAFTPVYILVITAAALLLPPVGVAAIWCVVSMAFLGDVRYGHPDTLSTGTLVITVLFGLVALVTGWLGARLRSAGSQIDAVESALRQLRLDTGDILATLSTGLMTVDGSGRLAYINRAGEGLLGLDGRTWLNRPVIGEVSRIAGGLSEAIVRSIETSSPVSREKSKARVNGGRIVLGISTAVLEGADDGPPSVTAIFQDITDAERLENLNRRNERLEAVAELSASLAHEIKNPLASIRSSIEQLVGPRLQPEDRNVLQQLILSESDRLSRLLSEFIEFARIRSGSFEPVDVAECVHTAVALAREHPDAAPVACLDVRGADAPLAILGDADLLHQAVFNLVLNALQFAGEKGTVRVEVSGVRANGSDPIVQPHSAVRVVVSDSGPGVAAEHAARVFDPFFTTRDQGSGLGLSVVHRAVDAHQGSVIVDESALGGARFVLYLPAAPSTGA
jgi:two-component system sensor histidine kinase PilS (NtrC family)